MGYQRRHIVLSSWPYQALKQARVMQQLARRHLRHSHSAAAVSAVCRCKTCYKKAEVRSDLWNHPRQASLVACLTANRLQIGSSGLQVPTQWGSSLSDGDGVTRVTHSRSRRCCCAEYRECLVGSSRFLKCWEQFSNWLKNCKSNCQWI